MSSSSSTHGAVRLRRAAAAAGLLLALGAGLGRLAGARAAAPVFYPDDPIAVDDDRAFDAGGAAPIEASDYYDFIENTFFAAGEHARVKAFNVNTADEVPDSSWFTNRLGRRDLSIEEIVRGPDRFAELSIDGWPIVEGKTEGRQPGWRVADPQGRLYQIEFDPPSHPEMATGAELIGTALYHAFGYNVVDVYLVEVDPARITISPKATIRDIGGKRRPLTRADVDAVLRRAARRPDGRYRALASRFADGRPLGNFRYHGTRPDDPNDIFPHEHRRELRANRVFAAWLNHDDSRGINSLDMLVGEPGRRWIRHYMFDFGSILGSGTDAAQVPRAGNEYIYDLHEGLRTLLSLGLYLRPWLRIRYPEMPPAVGRFEGTYFDPERWVPEYPNPAFDNMRDDDAYWGARILARLSPEAVRAVVAKARYTDPRATDYLVQTLLVRREKVLRAWLTRVVPVDDIRLDSGGRLQFTNPAVAAGVAPAPERYLFEWFRFDNATGAHEAVGGEVVATEPGVPLPAELRGADYAAVRIRAVHPAHPLWLRRPTRVYFRRTAEGWQTVGIERIDDGPPLGGGRE
ncbi:MAG TPA: hypothetical protein VNI83_02790 [Vicinamibacterales bacterium]|nr:hypothetical protein [Vicinamibacterales bacterium]